MKKIVILFIVFSLITSVYHIIPTEVVKASGNTIYVDDDGGADYTTIQAAVNVASPGDIIIVRTGTYIENIDIDITKDFLTIKSEQGAFLTNVQPADPEDHIFGVESDHVTIKGFTIEGERTTFDFPNFPACISLGDIDCTTTIYPGPSSNNCNITDNILRNNCYGIRLVRSDYNSIINNTAYENQMGICLYEYNEFNLVSSNTLLKNTWMGLYIRGNNNTAIKNKIMNNVVGIHLEDAEDNTIYLNDIIENSYSVTSQRSSNIWASPEMLTYSYDHRSYTNFLGNYWNDYTGSDTNNNGLGDIPYNMESNSDNYPLMMLFENYLNGENQPPITAAFDQHLLNLIDQYAGSYYNSNWNLNINQYKAWILSIAWGEGGRGGYVAHSQGSSGSDLFNHIATNIGDKFTFSTGLGPFQLDNGGYDHWELWCTIDKLDPEKAVKTILNQHYKKYGDGKTLWDFSNSSSWLSVNPNYFDRAKILWNQVTGTDWDIYKRGKTDLEWSSIKNGLIANAKNNPIYEYDENIKNVGKVKWNITSDDNIKTDSPQAKTVIFDNYYDTWLITARSGSGYKLFDYYYTKDPEQKIELWVWNNSGDAANKLKYIYVRDNSTGQYPENRTADKLSAGHILSHAALDPSKKLIEQGKAPITPGFELILVVFAIALVFIWKRKRYN